MATTSRLELVRRRAEQWATALVDLTPRNPLLYFKDTASTLDLTDSAAPGLDRLFTGNAVRLSALVLDPEARTTACRRLRSVRKRVVLAAEEQGIEIGRLARGLVRVEPPAGRGSAPVRAPLLLQPVRIEPRTTAENDYSLAVEGDLEVNPVLLVALHREHGIDLDVSDLGDRLALAVDSTDDPDAQMGAAFDILRRLLSAEHRAIELEQRTVVGCFVFDKLPMMEDLLNSAELLAEHDVVAAAAGDPSAMEALRRAATGHRPLGADEVAPADEFLVLDADSSQHDAVRAVLDGQHVVIQGPPGTGKSQTIANIIGAAAADGKRVLFVTEKRAAIEAVTERLAEVGLAELVLDLHAQRISRREVAQQVAKSLDLLGSAMPPDVEQLHHRLAVTRRQLVRYTAETHEDRAPWGLSAHAVQRALLGMPAHVRSAPLCPEQYSSA
ncbi:MAG: DUF4011 domain-containing protein [Pseudonocardiaceae bacterium]